MGSKKRVVRTSGERRQSSSAPLCSMSGGRSDSEYTILAAPIAYYCVNQGNESNSRLCVDGSCLRLPRALARAALAAGLCMTEDDARAALEIAAHFRAAARKAKAMSSAVCGRESSEDKDTVMRRDEERRRVEGTRQAAWTPEVLGPGLPGVALWVQAVCGLVA